MHKILWLVETLFLWADSLVTEPNDNLSKKKHLRKNLSICGNKNLSDTSIIQSHIDERFICIGQKYIKLIYVVSHCLVHAYFALYTLNRFS